MGTNPLENRYITERMTELVVIVALMGAGLKLDRPVNSQRRRRRTNRTAESLQTTSIKNQQRPCLKRS